MLYFKDNRGITLIALITIIIVLLIIAGVAIYEGKDLIKDVKVETLETNMLAIKAKAKVYAEEVEAKTETWKEDDSESSSEREEKVNELFKNYGIESDNDQSLGSEATSQINNVENKKYYSVKKEALQNMGIEDDGEYIIVFDSKDYSKMDIIYSPGISYNKKTYYTLSELQTVFREN